jgi:hypothetical protein
VDAGFVLVADILDEGFPIPWLSFSYHFGPSRKAAHARTHDRLQQPGRARPRP